MKKVLLPTLLEECWDVLEHNPEARIFCGGTDLLVQLRAGEIDSPVLIGLEKITELSGVREEGGTLWIGAASTHGQLLDNPLIRSHLSILASALSTLGSPLIRSMGTIGGNICTASPAGDSLPPLYILDAEVEVGSRRGLRRLPIGQFIKGPGLTDLKPDEILLGVRVAKPERYNCHHSEKVGQRKSLACAIASMAALLKVSGSGIIEDAHLAWGSVAPTVLMVPAAEAALTGKRLCRETLEEASVLVRGAASPIDDIRASAEYRRDVAGNLLLRLLPA